MLPFFKNNGKRMLANAVKTGMEVADDVLEGQSFKESAKKRVPAGIKRTVQNLDWQSGSGIKRKRVGTKRRVKRRRRKRGDLFS